MKNGNKAVQVPKSVLDKGSTLWDDCLIGQFFGASPKLAVIQATVDKLWGRAGYVEVIPLTDEGFMFRFTDLGTKNWVLEGGPWFIANRPLLLQQWKPGLVLDKLSLKKFPIWIALRGVPLELFTPEGLSCIASAVGVPLSLDKATEQRRRVQFARVCVEISCGDLLPDQILVEIETLGQRIISVEYAWKPAFCTLCKNYGHHISSCKGVRDEWRSKKPTKGAKDVNTKVPSSSSSQNSVVNEKPTEAPSRSSDPVTDGFKFSDKGTTTTEETCSVSLDEEATCSVSSDEEATDINTEAYSEVQNEKAKSTDTRSCNANTSAGMQPTEASTSVLDGSQQKSEEINSKSGEETGLSDDYLQKESEGPAVEQPTEESPSVMEGSQRASDSFTFPSKSCAASPKKVSSTKVITKNSFSVLDKAQGIEATDPPVKRARKQTQKASESMAQGTKGLGVEISSSK